MSCGALPAGESEVSEGGAGVVRQARLRPAWSRQNRGSPFGSVRYFSLLRGAIRCVSFSFWRGDNSVLQ